MPRRFEVPKEKVLGILELMDAHGKAPAGEDNVTKYRLWQAVEEAVPGTAETGRWTIQCYGTRMFLVEREDD